MKFFASLVSLSAVCLLAQVPQAKPPAPAPRPPVVRPPMAKPPAPAPAAPAVPPDKVVLTVGDEKVTAGEISQLIAALPENYRRMIQAGGMRQFGENLVRVRLLAQQARRSKLDEDPAVKAQLEFQRESLLAGTAMTKLLETSKVSEADARKYYDEHKNDYERVRARHVLIRMKGSPVPARPGQKDLTEEEALAKAQEVRQKLLAGGDFAAIAKAESDDTGTAAKGGELGYFKHGQMVPQFDQAAFKLEVGKVSEPVKTNYGYHLIEVEQKDSKTFEEALPEIEKQMRPKMAETIIENLKKDTPVTMDDAYFGPTKK